MNGLAHSAAGTFDIHDQDGPRINPVDRHAPAGFNQDKMTFVQERRDQRINFFMKERLSAGQLDAATSDTSDLLQERFDRSLHPFVKSIGGVAPSAARLH